MVATMRRQKRDRQSPSEPPREPGTAENLESIIDTEWKRISRIALLAVAVGLSIVTIIGIILRDSLTPRLIDAAFGISEHVGKELSKNIDSGYSQFFQISGTSRRKYLTTFYADEGQKVSVTVTGHAVVPLTNPPVPVQVFVDKKLWTTIWIPDPDSSYRYNGDATEDLNFKDPPSKGMHEVRLVPPELANGEEVFVRTLVLVRNNFDKN